MDTTRNNEDVVISMEDDENDKSNDINIEIIDDNDDDDDDNNDDDDDDDDDDDNNDDNDNNDDDNDNDDDDNDDDNDDDDDDDDTDENKDTTLKTKNENRKEKQSKPNVYSNDKYNSLTNIIQQNRNSLSESSELSLSTLFSENILQRNIIIPFHKVDANIENLLFKKIQGFEGKCNKEGFIRPKSISLLSYSSGLCDNSNVIFVVTFKCLICIPVIGMTIKVKVLNKTKAGIRASSRDPNSPIDVFVTRDHNIQYDSYKKLDIDDMFTVKIIGHRFEINDTRISVIADIYEKKDNQNLIVVES
jgi:DNA-directed RNA polymerase subunit E'/Rpb7